MIDLTPPPFGDVTRRWTQLEEHERRACASRLLGHPLAGEDDGLDLSADDYERLVVAARARDPLAFSWLATVHRRLLLHRGRALFEDDPAEWGSLALEVLNRVLHRAQLDSGRWLRRHIACRLSEELGRRNRQFIARRRAERATDPTVVLPALASARPGPDHDPHPELSVALSAALRRLDPAVASALRAVADGASVDAIALAHDLPKATLRQQVHRARRRLQPELAAFQRTR